MFALTMAFGKATRWRSPHDCSCDDKVIDGLKERSEV
jgi:hypothetical protein